MKMKKFYVTIHFKGQDQGGFKIEATDLIRAFTVASVELDKKYSKLEVGFMSLSIKEIEE
jgi:hypothetical protein